MRDYTIVLSGFASYIAIVVHSFADFNLHIPANALLFTIIISMAYSIIISRGIQEISDKRAMSFNK